METVQLLFVLASFSRMAFCRVERFRIRREHNNFARNTTRESLYPSVLFFFRPDVLRGQTGKFRPFSRERGGAIENSKTFKVICIVRGRIVYLDVPAKFNRVEESDLGVRKTISLDTFDTNRRIFDKRGIEKLVSIRKHYYGKC